MNYMKFLMKIYDGLVSTRSAGLYLILFAIAIGAATFIENDYGTSAAQKSFSNPGGLNYCCYYLVSPLLLISSNTG